MRRNWYLCTGPRGWSIEIETADGIELDRLRADPRLRDSMVMSCCEGDIEKKTSLQLEWVREKLYWWWRICYREWKVVRFIEFWEWKEWLGGSKQRPCKIWERNVTRASKLRRLEDSSALKCKTNTMFLRSSTFKEENLRSIRSNHVTWFIPQISCCGTS